MRAMVLTGHGGLDKYEWHEDWPVPEPDPDQVLIRVAACGLNNTDVNTRTGWYAREVREATSGEGYGEIESGTWGGSGISFPRIQGADVCGRVVAVGANVDPALIGKRVITDNWLRDWSDPLNREKARYFGSEADGGFAEYTVIDHRNVGVVDCDLSDAELATFSCSYTTAEGMLSRAGVGRGERVLITGASGGVGSALIQLAGRRGAITIALASPAKHAQVAELKPAHILDRAPADLAAALHGATGHDRVDVVADIVGGPYFATLLDQLVRGGRYVTSGAIAGPIVELDLRTLYLNDLQMHGSTVVEPHIFRDLVSYIERGEIRPVLAATYPLEKLREAQTAFIEKKHTGNIVVVP
ncbi:MAG: alcohol dehydrogenase [Alphaproteobacteria bacterium]|nr:MAG: alcohol dehydrogenase [Alphaproteobacteria bacterium]